MRRSALILLLLVAACGSAPTQVFTLSASGDRAERPVPAGRAPLVYVDRATVAEYFDRTQMVTRLGEYRVSLHEFAVWGEPVADLITGALVDDLARRFGDDRVMRTPRGGAAPPDARVELDVLRFDVDERGAATLDARWSVAAGDGHPAARRRERVVTKATDPKEAASRVAALREAIAVLAGRIGDAAAAAASRRR